MSDKIPTAEKYGESLLPRGITWYKEFDEMMIGFAQLHVEAALKAASEKAKFFPISTWNCEPRGVQPEVNKQSILNAYDKNLII